jgi:hypothetical protein
MPTGERMRVYSEGTLEVVNQPGSARDRPDRKRPRRSGALGGFLAGIFYDAQIGAALTAGQRSSAGTRRQPDRSEIVMVIACTMLSVVAGAAVGWWLLSGIPGAVIGAIGGLLFAMVPIGLGSAVLKKVRAGSPKS